MMKSILKITALAAVIAAATPNLSAQDIYPQKNDKGKWGYVDANGKKAIDYKYDDAQPFVDGKAQVRKGDVSGFINDKGKEIIPIKYNIIERHNDNVYRVATNGKMQDGILSNEKYGFIGADGKEILKPEYDEIGLFKDGRAFIKKGNLYGYINNEIEIVIPCKYNAVGSINKNGYIWVCEGASFEKGSTTKFSGGKYGIYDRNGKTVIPCKYKTVGGFVPYVSENKKETLDKLHFNHRTVLTESGTHRLLRKWTMPREVFSKLPETAVGFYYSNRSDGYKNSVVDLKGNIIVPEGKYETVFYPTDGKALVLDKKSTYNYLDIESGKLMFKKPVKDAWAFQDGVAVISRDKGMELIDLDGEAVSKVYKKIFPRKDGVYIVQSDENPKYTLYGAIDAKGREIIPAKQSFVYPPSNGLMACRELDNEYGGYRDTKGNWVIEPDRYTTVYSFKNGIADVNTKDGWGIIDPSGNEVVKCRWAKTKVREADINGYIWVSSDESDNARFKLLKISDDEVVTSKGYRWCRNYGVDIEKVAFCGDDDEHIGVIDNMGNVIIPMQFTYKEAETAYKYILYTGQDEWEEFDTYKVKLYSNPKRNKANLSHKIDSALWDY